MQQGQVEKGQWEGGHVFWVSDRPPVVVGPDSLMEGEERMGRGGGDMGNARLKGYNSFIQFSYFIKTTI